MKGLTEKQAAVLAYIRDRVSVDGYPPTFEEIMARFGFCSREGAACHVRALKKKGFITNPGGAARSIRVVGAEPRKPAGNPARMPSLTPAQSRLYRYLASCGSPPTLREICGQMGWSGTNAASGHLKALERKGLIRRKAGGARAITVV